MYDMFVQIGPSIVLLGPSIATSYSAVREHDSTHSGKVSLSVYIRSKYSL